MRLSPLLRQASTLALRAVLALSLIPALGHAQLPVGYTDAGAVIGLGNIGDAGLSVGLRAERVLRTLPSLGKGTLGIGIGLNYYAYDSGIPSARFEVSYLPIAASANYHFALPDKRYDLYLGLGLGVQIVNCTYSVGGSSVDLCDNGGAYLVARAGGRYFMTPRLAAYADLGAGDAALNLGMTLKLR